MKPFEIYTIDTYKFFKEIYHNEIKIQIHEDEITFNMIFICGFDDIGNIKKI